MPNEERRLTAVMFTDLVGYTALMGRDETQALATVERSQALIRSCVEKHAGRYHEHEGDGTLSTFTSAVQAVAAAVEAQEAVHSAGIDVRIGIHIGDILTSDQRIAGDGVNVTARICAQADGGDIYVSETVYDQVRNQSGLQAQRIGAPPLKNVNRPIVIWSLRAGSDLDTSRPASSPKSKLRRAAMFVGGLLTVCVVVLALNAEMRNRIAARLLMSLPSIVAANLERTISSTHSADGTLIAYGSVGQGTPILQVQVWATHVEYGPVGPMRYLPDFVKDKRVVYYDGRGFGLSQRGVEHSQEKRIQDIEAVVEASGLERFAVWGFSGGTPAAIEYVARNPERVTALILYGTILRQPLDDETASATLSLIKRHWGSNEPAFRDFFRGLMVPDATDFEMSLFTQALANAGDVGDAAAFWQSMTEQNSTAAAGRIRVPTLVLHRRDDVLVPMAHGLEAASLIPGARFVALEGKNHIFLPGEAEGRRTLKIMDEFLSEHTGRP